MTTILQALITARAKIDAPEKWTKGKLARDSKGREVPENDAKACKFCCIGACFADLNYPAGYCSHCIAILHDHLPPNFKGVSSFNDHPDTTHADVMALFDRAITAQPKE